MIPRPKPGTRRGFLVRLGAVIGGTSVGAGILGPNTVGAQPSLPSPPSGPLVHPADAWLDGLPRGHRMVFDAFTLPGAVHAGRFCGNWMSSNASGYGLTPGQLGAVIVLRSAATIFAFDDTIWAKYPVFGQQTKPDPATGKPYSVNPFLRDPSQGDATSQGVEWRSLVAQGVHFAVCNGTTTGLAAAIAGPSATDSAIETVRQELAAHLVANGHLMATGIVALGRAQEKGFTFGCGG